MTKTMTPQIPGIIFFFLATDQLYLNREISVVTEQHEWSVVTKPLCRDNPLSRLPVRTRPHAEPRSRACRARWTSLAQSCRGQPLLRHHTYCHDRRKQFPVTTKNSLSRPRLCHPWPNCVATWENIMLWDSLSRQKTMRSMS